MIGPRDRLRLVTSFEYAFHQLMAPALVIFSLFCGLDEVAVGGSSIVALTLPQNHLAASNEPER